jgi:hypothetical protein
MIEAGHRAQCDLQVASAIPFDRPKSIDTPSPHFAHIGATWLERLDSLGPALCADGKRRNNLANFLLERA